MKNSIMIGLMLALYSGLVLSQADAADPDNTENQQVLLEAIDENSANVEKLAQLTQPTEDATSVKVIVQKKQTIEEYRQRGELILVKVIPNDGVPYFIDPMERNNIRTSGRDLINSGVKPVRWVLKEF